MDLTQLANLGEFVGGVAVLVTLVYLAIQVRQSAASQQKREEVAAADAMRSNIMAFSAYRQMRASESTGELWATSVAESLSLLPGRPLGRDREKRNRFEHFRGRQMFSTRENSWKSLTSRKRFSGREDSACYGCGSP